MGFGVGFSGLIPGWIPSQLCDFHDLFTFSDSHFPPRRKRDDRGLKGAGARTCQPAFKAWLCHLLWPTVALWANCFIETPWPFGYYLYHGDKTNAYLIGPL